MNSEPLPEDGLIAQRRAAVGRTVEARIAELRWPMSRVAKLSGLSVNTIKGVTRATGCPHPSTLVALSAVLGWDPQYLNAIVHGRALPGATRQASLASQNALLAKQITGLRAEIAGLTQANHRTNLKLEMLIRRIDTLMSQPPRQDSPAQGAPTRLACRIS